jgi:phosphatidylinositol glycan class B
MQLLMTVLSPWQWFCSTRTLSNSLEASLTIFAFYNWPWELLGPEDAKSQQSKLFGTRFSYWRLAKSLLASGVACVLRPTNLLIWVTLLITNIDISELVAGNRSLLRDCMYLLVGIISCG